jgi:uncharacterized protein DUF3606
MTLEPKHKRVVLYGPTATRVDLTSPSSVTFWTRFWNVTLIQLRIAVGRVGASPSDVARELGLGPYAAIAFPRVAAPAAISQETRGLVHQRRSG